MGGKLPRAHEPAGKHGREAHRRLDRQVEVTGEQHQGLRQHQDAQGGGVQQHVQQIGRGEESGDPHPEDDDAGEQHQPDHVVEDEVADSGQGPGGCQAVHQTSFTAGMGAGGAHPPGDNLAGELYSYLKMLPHRVGVVGGLLVHRPGGQIEVQPLLALLDLGGRPGGALAGDLPGFDLLALHQLQGVFQREGRHVVDGHVDRDVHAAGPDLFEGVVVAGVADPEHVPFLAALGLVLDDRGDGGDQEVALGPDPVVVRVGHEGVGDLLGAPDQVPVAVLDVPLHVGVLFHHRLKAFFPQY